jgi:prepilin-type N-terminal cleavage/methylation domain-containing protein
MKKSHEGFTLVEIMIVVAIILLLAIMAIPNMVRTRINANDTSARAALKSISTALENYYGINNIYPTDPSVLLGDTPPYLSQDYFAAAYNGYNFTYTITNYSYTITATPITPGTTGTSTVTITTGSVFQ